MDNVYRAITEARMILELQETATMDSIKSSYRRLLTKWHPDKGMANKDICNEMTLKIISAYKTIMDYCNGYHYSFTEEAVKNNLSPEQWWFERFGDDPLWGTGKKWKWAALRCL